MFTIRQTRNFNYISVMSSEEIIRYSDEQFGENLIEKFITENYIYIHIYICNALLVN